MLVKYIINNINFTYMNIYIYIYYMNDFITNYIPFLYIINRNI